MAGCKFGGDISGTASRAAQAGASPYILPRICRRREAAPAGSAAALADRQSDLPLILPLIKAPQRACRRRFRQKTKG